MKSKKSHTKVKSTISPDGKKYSSNDQLVLEQLLDEWQNETYKDEGDKSSSLDQGEIFETFCSETILRNYDLDYDELESGIVDGEHDGGIDSIYVFVNGKLISDNVFRHLPKTNVKIEIIVIQAKCDSGYNEKAMNNLIMSAKELFNLQASMDKLRDVYNERLREIVERFQEVYKYLATSFPELIFKYYYTVKAKTGDEVHSNVTRKIKPLEETLKGHFGKCELNFEFIGARELFKMTRQAQRRPLILKYSKGPLTAIDGSCAVLAHLHDYYQFITEDLKGVRRLRREIFESNVRDYEGDVDVNEDIHQTLSKPLQNEDFWWFNNGVTILTTDVTSSGEQLTIKEPQIVNGLQTSVEISRHFTPPNSKSRKRIPTDKRNILIRVVKCNDESRNRIIKATNYQTKIPITSLLAMADPFQEKIEVYLKSNNYYYERRKNYYKNLKKPRGRIVSVTFLAQAIIAIVLKEAYTARARPADLLREKDDYYRVFNKEYPLELYLTCVDLVKRVERFLRREAPLYIQGNENNVKFQLSMFVVMALTEALKPRVSSVAQIDLEEVNPTFLKKCLKHVWTEFRQIQKKLKYISTKASKSPDFDSALIDRYRKILQKRISF